MKVNSISDQIIKVNNLTVILLAVGAFGFLSGYFSKNWTLMVCEQSSDNLTCDQNRYVEKGFGSLKSCRRTGDILYDLEGIVYECGYKCKLLPDSRTDMSCKTLCDRVGCSD